MLAPFGGMYWHEERMLVTRFASHERGLALVAGDQPRPLEGVDEGLYRVGDQSTHYRFIEGPPRRVERVPENGAPLVLVAQEPWTPASPELDRYAGTYFSEELQTEWRSCVTARPSCVLDLRAPARVLTPAFRRSVDVAAGWS